MMVMVIATGHVRVYQRDTKCSIYGLDKSNGQDIDGEAANDYSGHSRLSLSADGSIVMLSGALLPIDGNGKWYELRTCSCISK